MSINKENYLEYFLLYTDNELSFSERQEVEDFVALHPELKDELDALQLTVLPADEHHYEPITELSKFNGLTVQHELMLHLDDELAGDEKIEIEKLIQRDNAVAEEWKILQTSKLSPEAIVFEDKVLLYRKTRRPIIIPMPFRMMAAAVLVGAGFYIGIEHNKEAVEPNYGIPQEEIVKAPKIEPHQQYSSVVDAQIELTESHVEPAVEEIEIKDIPASSVHSPAKEFVAQKNISEKVDNGSNILKVSSVQSVENPPIFIPEEIDRTPITSLVSTENVPVVRERKNPYAFTAQNEEITQEVPEYAVDKTEEKKQGGFFKKVKRVIEKKTKVENDGNVLIGAFEIAIR